MPEPYRSALDAASSIERVGNIVRTAARRATGADGATFVLRDGDLCFYADEDAIAPLWKGQRFPMSECISGWAMIRNESVAIPNIELDERIPLVAYRPTFVRSLLMAPIDRREPVGAIGAYWAAVGVPPAGTLAALEELADCAAAAIDRIGLETAPWAPSFRVPGGTVRPALQRD